MERQDFVRFQLLNYSNTVYFMFLHKQICQCRISIAISAVGGGVDLDIIEFEEQRKNIDKIILHENYNHSHPDPMNDICLLKVLHSIDF